MNRTHRAKMLIMAGVGLLSLVSGAGAEEIAIVGTGSGTVILEALGKAFTQQNPGVTMTLPASVGSAGGIKAVGRDEAVLGRVSREIKENEKPYELKYVPFAKNPIVFMVNKNVNVPNLSAQQVLDLYSGKVTNWKEVGGSDAKVRVVRRQDGDSTHDVLVALLPGFKDITITTVSKTAFTDMEARETVENTAGAMVYGSYADAKAGDVKIVSVEGKNGTEADYPYVSTLALIYKEKNYTGNLKKFVDFATSEAALEIIKSASGIPLL